MLRTSIIAATLIFAVLVPAANAREKNDMMMPTMQQCHDGYQKMYKTSMNWSKHHFKHACHKMMKHQEKTTRHMMKHEMMKKKM